MKISSSIKFGQVRKERISNPELIIANRWHPSRGVAAQTAFDGTLSD